MPLQGSNAWLSRGAALLVLGSALTNGLGALALPQASLAYQPGQLAEWLDVNLANPGGAEWGRYCLQPAY